MDNLIKKYEGKEFKNQLFEGSSLNEVVSDLIEFNLLCFSESLKKYDKTNLFDMTGRMVRGIEEFINLLNEIKIEKFMELAQFPLSKPEYVKKLERFLFNNFPDSKLVGRLINIYMQLSAYKDASKMLGIDLEFNNVGEGIAYLQSRRIYLHTLQPMILKYCEGNEKISSEDFLLAIFPLIEIHLFAIGNLTSYLEINHALEDYQIRVNGTFPDLSLSSNYTHNSLEFFFLSPTRIPFPGIAKHIPNKLSDLRLQELEKNKILSYKECLTQIDYLEKLFDEYDLKDHIAFVLFSKLIKELSKNVYYDYYIVVSKKELMKKLKKIFGKQKANETYAQLIIPKNDFVKIINSSRPFIYFQKNLYSTIYQLNRFIFYITQDFLSKNKKFQINSGFIFEKIIKEELTKNSFSIKNITRLKNEHETFSEFDVVATKNQIIYNFQCKNNYLDISHIKEDYEKFGTENRNLVKMYEKAYVKEKKRENLLLDKLKLKYIKHYVITKFPVITRKPYIITYQNFEDRIKSI